MTRAPAPLPRRFFERDPVTVAKALLGQRLVHVDPASGEQVSGLIVETEAYLGIVDEAAHTFGGRRTARNESMWQQGGTLYVYFTYGMHHCANIVSGKAGDPTAVLIRALQPDAGLGIMFARRRAAKRERDLCSGPAKLCEALGLTRDHDGTDLVTDAGLLVDQVRRRALPGTQIAAGPRVGVGYAGDWATKPLRFWIRGNPHVSQARGTRR